MNISRTVDDHLLHTLPRSARWRLFLGGPYPTSPSPVRERQGRFVGIVAPLPNPLSPMPPDVEFARLDPTEQDRMLQDLMDAPVGIFGIQAPVPERGLKLDSLVTPLHVSDWILRSLPVRHPVHVQVMLGRPGDPILTPRARRRLANRWFLRTTQRCPRNYRNVHMTIVQSPEDGWPFMGYVDAIGHLWSTDSPAANRRREAYPLVGCCLHDIDGPRVVKARDRLLDGLRVDEEDYQALAAVWDAGITLASSRPFSISPSPAGTDRSGP